MYSAKRRKKPEAYCDSCGYCLDDDLYTEHDDGATIRCPACDELGTLMVESEEDVRGNIVVISIHLVPESYDTNDDIVDEPGSLFDKYGK